MEAVNYLTKSAQQSFPRKSQDLLAFVVGILIVFGYTLVLSPQLHQTCASLSQQVDYFGLPNISQAVEMAKRIQVYCFVPCSGSTCDGVHLQRTWLKRCAGSAIVTKTTSASGPDLGPETPSNNVSWLSLSEALVGIHKSSLKPTAFLKADIDTYVIMENLRYLLSKINTSEAFIIGNIDRHDRVGGKLSFSAGYVISPSALNLIVTRGIPSVAACKPGSQFGDSQISICAEALGIKVRDEPDFLRKSRFSNTNVFDLVGPFKNNTPRWIPMETDYTLPNFDLHKLPASPLMVSFKKIDSVMMYVMEYLVYHLRAYGIRHTWPEVNIDKL